MGITVYPPAFSEGNTGIQIYPPVATDGLVTDGLQVLFGFNGNQSNFWTTGANTQIVYDYSGNTNNGTLGADTDPDTDDPGDIVGNLGIEFDETNDFITDTVTNDILTAALMDTGTGTIFAAVSGNNIYTAVILDSTTLTFYLNGTVTSPASLNQIFWIVSPAGIPTGQRYAGAVYDRVLSESEVQQMTFYMATQLNAGKGTSYPTSL